MLLGMAIKYAGLCGKEVQVVGRNRQTVGERDGVRVQLLDGLPPEGITKMSSQFDSIDAIRQSGFEGFVTISALQESRCCDVPDVPGVYLVLRASKTPPEFLGESTGGHFKGKNPAVLVSELELNWVEDAIVLNIGKAGPSKGRTLRSRLAEYMQFGQGEPVGHAGGRYIWQLADSSELLVCWKATPDVDPKDEESRLIKDFEAIYKKLPFANLQH